MHTITPEGDLLVTGGLNEFKETVLRVFSTYIVDPRSTSYCKVLYTCVGNVVAGQQSWERDIFFSNNDIATNVMELPSQEKIGKI